MKKREWNPGPGFDAARAVGPRMPLNPGDTVEFSLRQTQLTGRVVAVQRASVLVAYSRGRSMLARDLPLSSVRRIMKRPGA